MWGTIINGIQAACLEHQGIRDGPWTGATVGFLIAYTAGTISLSFCPRFFRLITIPSYVHFVYVRSDHLSSRFISVL
jgi:solute carrier family 35 protein F1/2